MKRIVVMIHTMLLSSVLLMACSKDRQIQMDEIHGNAIDAVKNIETSPMPKDSAQIDSLNRPGFN